MKITILSPAYPLRGGIAQFNSQLYKELVKSHDVNVLTFSRQYPKFLFPGKTQFEEKQSGIVIPSEMVIDSINPFNWIKIGLRLKRSSPDLIIFKYWMPFFAPCFGTILRIARLNKKIKTLVILHNAIAHEKLPFDKSIARYFLNKIDYFITLSKSVFDDLLTIISNEKNVEHKLLFHPVYTNFGEPVSKDEARKKLSLNKGKLILFFGFIRDYKGLDVLLKAMNLLHGKDDIRLIIAGEFYSNEAMYQSMIDELNIRDRVILFNNFIPAAEVRYYFSASDVVVLPYKNATQSGITAIAKHFYKPVIATKVGGLAEIIHNGKDGYLVDADNPQKLADAIIKYYEENKETEFSQNIKKELEELSWEKFSEELINFVNKS